MGIFQVSDSNGLIFFTASFVVIVRLFFFSRDYTSIACVIVLTLFFFQPNLQILLRCNCCDKMC